MQDIDPPKRPQQIPGPGSRRRSIDGVLPPNPSLRTASPSPPTNRAPVTPANHSRPVLDLHKAPPPRQRSRSKSVLLIAVQAIGFIALLVLGFLVRFAVIGQALIAIYAFAALVFRISSRTTFALAMIALFVVLVSNIRSDPILAESFAVYAFLLLIVGTVSLGLEVRDEI
jgi:hypothetical protein